MEYFTLMATLLCLFSGLLFYVDALPGRGFSPELKFFLIAITMIIVIGSNLVVLAMFGFDVYVRRSKDQKILKKKLKLMKTVASFDEYAYNQEFKESNSSEDHSKSINDIIANVISFKRFAKNVAVVDAKRKQFQTSLTATVIKSGVVGKIDSDVEKRMSKFINYKRGAVDLDVVGKKMTNLFDKYEIGEDMKEVNEFPYAMEIESPKSKKAPTIDLEKIKQDKKNALLGLKK
jgi:hypothetical protein